MAPTWVEIRTMVSGFPKRRLVVILLLQVEANVDPSFTCLVWQKLEQQVMLVIYTEDAPMILYRDASVHERKMAMLVRDGAQDVELFSMLGREAPC